MKKHINLLHKNREYERIEHTFFLFRRITLFLGLIAFFLILALFFAQKQSESTYGQLLNTKGLYLKQQIQIKDMQQKVLYADDKTNFIKTVTKTDLNFAPYYALLKQSLFDNLVDNSSASATIDTLHFDNKRDVQIKMTLQNEDALTLFLRTVESDQFLELFQTVELTKLAGVGNGTRYEATIHGVLKPVPNEIF